MRDRVLAFAKTLAWPVRRYFGPRFDEIKTLVIADMAAADDATTFIGRSLEEVQSQVDQLATKLLFDPEAPHTVDEIDASTADVLNYEASHEGFAAQSSLWFNPPLLVGYEPQHVALRGVSERIAEVPYAFRSLGRVRADAAVLDVGAAESTVCLSLATLGYSVTAIDPRPNPLSHERLRVVVGTVEDWEPDQSFDAIVCLSTIEHVGTPAYGQEVTDSRADLAAMKRMRDVTRAGGLLVLTTPVGRASVGDFSRTYDRDGLDELLTGWDVVDLTLVQRQGPTSWITIDEPVEDLDPEAETVAMVTATKATG